MGNKRIIQNLIIINHRNSSSAKYKILFQTILFNNKRIYLKIRKTKQEQSLHKKKVEMNIRSRVIYLVVQRVYI